MIYISSNMAHGTVAGKKQEMTIYSEIFDNRSRPAYHPSTYKMPWRYEH